MIEVYRFHQEPQGAEDLFEVSDIEGDETMDVVNKPRDVKVVRMLLFSRPVFLRLPRNKHCLITGFIISIDSGAYHYWYLLYRCMKSANMAWDFF